MISIPDTHEALETLLQSLDLYANTLREWLAADEMAPSVRKFPKELRQLYEARIDFCEVTRRKLHDRQVELHLDKLYDAPSATGKKKAATISRAKQ